MLLAHIQTHTWHVHVSTKAGITCWLLLWEDCWMLRLPALYQHSEGGIVLVFEISQKNNTAQEQTHSECSLGLHL